MRTIISKITTMMSEKRASLFSSDTRKQTMWFPNKNDSNQAVQLLIMPLEAVHFGFRQSRNCTIRVAKTKALIRVANTAKLICAFGFARCRLLVFSWRSSFYNTNEQQIH